MNFKGQSGLKEVEQIWKSWTNCAKKHLQIDFLHNIDE